MKTITIKVPDGKEARWINDVLTLIDEQPKPITDRIKCFTDAVEWCEENGKEELVKVFKLIQAHLWGRSVSANKDIDAYLRLRIIATALNEGWKPTFEQGEKRWFVCADEEDTDEIGVCSADGVISYNESAMLLFRSSELAEYAATQFKDEYLEFCHKGKE